MSENRHKAARSTKAREANTEDTLQAKKIQPLKLKP